MMFRGQLLLFSRFWLLAFTCLASAFTAGSHVYGFTGVPSIHFTPDADIHESPRNKRPSNSSLSVVINPLPDAIKETSGLIYYDGGLWTFNDSGGLPEIYKIDTVTGQILQTVVLTDAGNIDWEDIAQDNAYIYIGDFGNNAGTRRDLCIYCLAKSRIPASGDASASATLIHYAYTDQASFNEANNNNNFDCEAMICAGDSLYLFTKRWADHRSMMYVLPKVPGTYLAQKRDSLEAGGLITGADFSEVYDEVALIGYNNYKPLLWLLSGFKGFEFLKGTRRRINFPGQMGAQTEGIAYTSGRNVFISAEKTAVYSQRIYKLNTAKWTSRQIMGRNGTVHQDGLGSVVFPAPGSPSTWQVAYNTPLSGTVPGILSIKLLTQIRKLLPVTDSVRFIFDTNDFATGSYQLRIRNG